MSSDSTVEIVPDVSSAVFSAVSTDVPSAVPSAVPVASSTQMYFDGRLIFDDLNSDPMPETNFIDDLVAWINRRRQKAYVNARDAPSEMASMREWVEEWDWRPEFTYYEGKDEQTCACGNVFCRPVSCPECEGKCLGQNYEREIDEICAGSGPCGHSCCCECDGCGYHPDQYKLPEPIPVLPSCMSSCSCGRSVE